MSPLLHTDGLPADTNADSLAPYLEPTGYLDFEHPRVRAFVADAIGSSDSPLERAVRLFYAVRDRIRYDPYRISAEDRSYRASGVIEDAYGWCVSKASLMAASARAAGIPAAIGLADVVNHLNTEKLRKKMGTDIFYNHGYVAMLIEGRWVKAVPAFNIELCERFGVKPTDFDGRSDALYQEYNARGEYHMQYLADHGTWSDLPLDKVREDFELRYPGLMVASVQGEGDGRFENDRPLA